MALKPWYKVVTPREDLRLAKPLDASEFAVHLDKVRDESAAEDYRNPEKFFERTYLTINLASMAAEVVRRLSGEKTEASAVFNLNTQFGGGKTHALTLLYHLAKNGPKAESWPGANKILAKSGVRGIPEAVTAVFVGTEFDSIKGRGGDDGTPLRKTPWGEIAFQLGGEEAFTTVAEHDRLMRAPAGDVIRQFLPKGRPCLILMDELMNYVSRNRKTDLPSQLYNFIQNLSETVRGEDRMVLVVSVPASATEMNPEDHSDYDRLKKLLDRLSKAVILSTETEISEIIRRRLFEFDSKSLDLNGKIVLPDEARSVCEEYARWVLDHRQQVPSWFPVDNARAAFEAAYPFHPMVYSVFERKWQTLPRFQRTRGVLRLLALWISRAYNDGYRGAHSDPIIGLGTAPLDDPFFRAAALEQLGEERLEVPITTDICGADDSHSIRLDAEAVDSIKKARLHQKVATSIFFESNGGRTSGTDATIPEVRLDVAEPGLDIGNVETVLSTLEATCYYLRADGSRYHFSLKVGLPKLIADRRAGISQPRIRERIMAEISQVFAKGPELDRVFFPQKSNDIPDRASLTLIVLPPDRSMQDREAVLRSIDSMTAEHGTSGRTFKSALIWSAAESDSHLDHVARDLLALEEIQDEELKLKLDDSQKPQLKDNLRRSERDLREAVWRTYRYVALLGRENVEIIDLGLAHSSAASSMVDLIISKLKRDDLVADSASPGFLVRNWPPAFKEWSTKAVRDAFFASPIFPRLSNPNSIKETIARGVSGGVLGYVGKIGSKYDPFLYKEGISVAEVEISEEMFIITAETAEDYIRDHSDPPVLTSIEISPRTFQFKPGDVQSFVARGFDQRGNDYPLDQVAWTATGGVIGDRGNFQAGDDDGRFTVTVSSKGVSSSITITIAADGGSKVIDEGGDDGSIKIASWKGEVPPQKWMNIYSKVLSGFAREGSLRLTLNVEISSEKGIPKERIEEMKVALRELGLNDEITI